tara:strand:+ start:412 stop:690 length:279 start_codon:yes stop_codon:yes gene_type:complete
MYNAALDRLIFLWKSSNEMIAETDDLWMRSEISKADRNTHSNPDPALIPVFENLCIDSHIRCWRKMNIEPTVIETNVANLKARLQIKEPQWA